MLDVVALERGTRWPAHVHVWLQLHERLMTQVIQQRLGRVIPAGRRVKYVDPGITLHLQRIADAQQQQHRQHVAEEQCGLVRLQLQHAQLEENPGPAHSCDSFAVCDKKTSSRLGRLISQPSTLMRLAALTVRISRSTSVTLDVRTSRQSVRASHSWWAMLTRSLRNSSLNSPRPNWNCTDCCAARAVTSSAGLPCAMIRPLFMIMISSHRRCASSM